MVIHVKAVFVNDETREEFPFDDEDEMHSIAGIFIYMTLRKHLLNDDLNIGLSNGICTVPVENTKENVDIIKNIYEDNGDRDLHPGYFQKPSHLRFYVINMPDAGIEQEVANHWHSICECGCKLEFIGFTPGLDIYVGNRWIIAQDKMKDYCWGDYLPLDRHETWLSLKNEIIKMYEEEYLNGTPYSEPWFHLYNYYVNVENDPIPLNGRLSYETNF
jgi:hypothetical protein